MAFWKHSTRASQEDAELFAELDSLIDELWGYTRYLADLKAIWPNLTEEQRSEIDNSATHQDRYHEKNAERLVEDIKSRTLEIRAHRHVMLKKKILDFLDDWRNQEPDTLKVIHAMMTRPNKKN